VGELAGAAGLTVRTLHYYDEIGLLSPSARTASGHRLYAAGDVERLYRICLLRRLGLPLREIGRALDDPAWSITSALAAHLAAVDRRLDATNKLRTHLVALLAQAGPDAAPTDELLGVLAEMTSLESSVQRRISILVYADLEAAFDFLVRVFALGPGELTRDEAGDVVHGELQVGDGVVWLHTESAPVALSSPRSIGAATATMAVIVEDVDAHFRHASELGAHIEYEPVDQPYGYREYSARDCEGGLWSFMKPLD
jgi:DNA-binding transcriptional MerR regulator/uncharacterized glyoxalase superfamily protein PhnB